jgi:hypothetical protein
MNVVEQTVLFVVVVSSVVKRKSRGDWRGPGFVLYREIENED